MKIEFKKISKILLFIAFFMIAIPRVDAARVLCSSSNYSKMRSKAYQTQFSYELKFTEEGSHYFTVYMTNLPEGIEMQFSGATYSYDKDNAVTALIPMFEGGKTYSFNLYATSGQPCVGELLYTKKLTIPKYNIFSEYEECIEYEEFPLCGKWYQGEIPSYNYFLEKLDAYKNSLDIEETPPEKVKEKNIFEKIIDFYITNIAITAPVTVLIVGGTIFIIIRNINRKKKRVKIDI